LTNVPRDAWQRWTRSSTNCRAFTSAKTTSRRLVRTISAIHSKAERSLVAAHIGQDMPDLFADQLAQCRRWQALVVAAIQHGGARRPGKHEGHDSQAGDACGDDPQRWHDRWVETRPSGGQRPVLHSWQCSQ
jgi:hypothetical protein